MLAPGRKHKSLLEIWVLISATPSYSILAEASRQPVIFDLAKDVPR